MFPTHDFDTLLAPRAARAARVASPLSHYAGLWKGSFRPDGSGSIPFTMRHADAALGEPPVLRFPSRAMPDVALRLLEASPSAYEAASSPFVDPATGVEVTFEIRGTRRHNRLAGRWAMRAADGVVLREGTFAAARYATAEVVNYRW